MRRAPRGLFAYLDGGRLGKERSSVPHTDCVPLPFEEVDCLRHRLDGLAPLSSEAQYLCPVEEHFRPCVEGVRLLRQLLSIEAEPRSLGDSSTACQNPGTERPPTDLRENIVYRTDILC